MFFFAFFAFSEVSKSQIEEQSLNISSPSGVIHLNSTKAQITFQNSRTFCFFNKRFDSFGVSVRDIHNIRMNSHKMIGLFLYESEHVVEIQNSKQLDLKIYYITAPSDESLKSYYFSTKNNTNIGLCNHKGPNSIQRTVLIGDIESVEHFPDENLMYYDKNSTMFTCDYNIDDDSSIKVITKTRYSENIEGIFDETLFTKPLTKNSFIIPESGEKSFLSMITKDHISYASLFLMYALVLKFYSFSYDWHPFRGIRTLLTVISFILIKFFPYMCKDIIDEFSNIKINIPLSIILVYNIIQHIKNSSELSKIERERDYDEILALFFVILQTCFRYISNPFNNTDMHHAIILSGHFYNVIQIFYIFVGKLQKEHIKKWEGESKFAVIINDYLHKLLNFIKIKYCKLRNNKSIQVEKSQNLMNEKKTNKIKIESIMKKMHHNFIYLIYIYIII